MPNTLCAYFTRIPLIVKKYKRSLYLNSSLQSSHLQSEVRRMSVSFSVMSEFSCPVMCAIAFFGFGRYRITIFISIAEPIITIGIPIIKARRFFYLEAIKNNPKVGHGIIFI